LRGLTQIHDPNLLVGSATSDDAAVYRLDDQRALVQTLDFFTPIVDDPYLYGQIAAANSLSDVYAMGGRPITAMNIVGVPTDILPPEVINAILRGGADKIAEAGCVLAGGHTVKNPEPLYGLSVTGLVHPDHVISNAGAKPGDLLYLTKPIGTGIITTAIKRGLASDALADTATQLMATLNTPGAAIGEQGFVRAGTDVTGFGLLGHLTSMCRESKVTAKLDHTLLPVIDPQVLAFIDGGCIPGGTRANLRAAEPTTTFADSVPEAYRLLLADAQTSGGLLLCVPPDNKDAVLALLESESPPCLVHIGKITAQTNSLVEVA